jgi:hypothetical protein
MPEPTLTGFRYARPAYERVQKRLSADGGGDRSVESIPAGCHSPLTGFGERQARRQQKTRLPEVWDRRRLI